MARRQGSSEVRLLLWLLRNGCGWSAVGWGEGLGSDDGWRVGTGDSWSVGRGVAG